MLVCRYAFVLYIVQELSSERLHVDFMCFMESHGSAIEIAIAGLDSKGKLAMPLVTSNTAAVAGLPFICIQATRSLLCAHS